MPETKSRISEVIRKRFPDNQRALETFGCPLVQYAESKIGPPHLIDEIETGDDGKFWSYSWEAMLYRHLSENGYNFQNETKASGQNGPDFKIEIEKQTIWLEAVVPSPEGLPKDWLDEPGPGKVCMKSKPDVERVLRCTSVIRDKHRKFAEYREKGIIDPGDHTVIAVNICRLSDWDIDGAGISQLPLVMEAVFPIGPLAIKLARDGKVIEPPTNTARFSLEKANGATVETGLFLDKAFSNVSAIIQGHQKYQGDDGLALSIVHNPLASRPMPRGLFSSREEFFADPQGDYFIITKTSIVSA